MQIYLSIYLCYVKVSSSYLLTHSRNKLSNGFMAGPGRDGPGRVGMVRAGPVHHGNWLYIEKKTFCSMIHSAKNNISRIMMLSCFPI